MAADCLLNEVAASTGADSPIDFLDQIDRQDDMGSHQHLRLSFLHRINHTLYHTHCLKNRTCCQVAARYVLADPDLAIGQPTTSRSCPSLVISEAERILTSRPIASKQALIRSSASLCGLPEEGRMIKVEPLGSSLAICCQVALKGRRDAGTSAKLSNFARFSVRGGEEG